MGRQSRPYPKPHRHFDQTFLLIQQLASRSDEKLLLFRAFPADIAPLEMTEQRLADRQLPSVAVMRSRTKNSARAKAHRRCAESYAKPARLHLRVGGLTRHLLEERRSKRGKPRIAPKLIDDEEGRPSARGALGRVLVTTLENHLMPLIRYEIGDYAIAAEGACPCGRTLPRIERIVGRVINLFVDRSGKRFVPWDLFNPMKAREWVTQYQVVQRDVDRFTVRYAATRVFTPVDEADVRRHFEGIIGSPIMVEFERLDQIPRAPSGKFMAALCELAAVER